MPTKVQAYAARTAKGPVEPFSYDAPPLSAHEVEIAVSHCGICHSDIAMIDNDWQMTKYPLVPGHEVVGTVSAVGEDVEGLKPGQRVGLGWQSGSCGLCEFCRRGKEHLCANEQDTIVGRHGGWASSVQADARFVVPIPEALESANVGPMMCAGSTVWGPILHYGVTAGMRTAVIGIGGLGHLAVQFLAQSGCEVTAISSTHSKDEEARRFGASDFIATKGTDELSQSAGRFDFILSTVSADLNWGEYIKALRPEGTLVLCGIPESELKIAPFGIIQGEKSVKGGRATSPSDVVQMLAFAARTGVKPMVETFPLANVKVALDHVRAGKARYRVVLTA
ncbi:MAG TPA: NAD(P)-dependent alcohol dehydrogenase [Chthoniobacterales bacterium]